MIAACALSFEAHANWYSGINLGINTTNIKKTLTHPLEDPAPATDSYNSTYSNAHGQLLVGYTVHLYPKISTDLEADAEIFTGKARYSINRWYFDQGALAEEQLQYGLSLYLLPSYQYTDTVRLFIGPGIARNRFAIKSGVTAGNVGVSGQFNRWLTGGGLKMGVANKISSNIELVCTYQYNQYNSTSWTNTEPLSEEILNGRYKPSANTFLIGLRII